MKDASLPRSVTSSASASASCSRPTIPTRFDALARMSPTEVSDLPPTANRSPHAHHQPPNVSRPRGPSRPKNANPVPVTVIGSSIVRGVGPFLSHDHDTVGYVYPGRSARYINGCLKISPKVTLLCSLQVVTISRTNLWRTVLKN